MDMKKVSTANGNVVLWLGYIHVNNYRETSEEWSKLLSLVEPSSEVDRIKRFRLHIDAKRSCLGHVLMRHYIQQHLHCANIGMVQFKRTVENKPYLTRPACGGDKNAKDSASVIDFNISHGGDLVLLGFVESLDRNRDRLLGIDVEKLEIRTNRNAQYPLKEFMESMESCFTNTEWDTILDPLKQLSSYSASRKPDLLKMLDTAPESFKKDVIERFFVHWTLKESFMKATGMGVAIELLRMQFTFVARQENVLGTSLLDRKARFTIDGQHLEGWTFASYKLENDHIASICIGPMHQHASFISKNLKESLLSPAIHTQNLLMKEIAQENEQLLSRAMPFELIKRPPDSLFT
jgi:4'-phosphopantetheinyl transferase